MSDTGPQREKLIHLFQALQQSGGFQLDWNITEHPAADASGEVSAPTLAVELSGADLPLLLDRNGELLHAIESLGASILRLSPEQAEQLSMDAGGFRSARSAEIERSAHEAIARVRSTGEPFPFPPMNARERRQLHLTLSTSGLPTASSGEGPRRFVVLYPEGATPEPERFAPPPPPRRGTPPSGRPGQPGSFRSGPRPAGGPRRPGPGSGRPGASRPDRDRRSAFRPDNFGNRAQEEASDPVHQDADQPAVSQDLPGERRFRATLDPNGNPIEQPAAEPDPTSPNSVEARLRKLRQTFRQR